MGEGVKRGIAVNEIQHFCRMFYLDDKRESHDILNVCAGKVCRQQALLIMFWYPRFSYHEGVFLVNDAIFC